jgi:K+ transporter
VADADLSGAGGTDRVPTLRRGAAARTGMAALTLGALGVVFGDIGTSPLYGVQAVLPPTAIRYASIMRRCMA